MNINLEYDRISAFQSSVNIEDIGNMALECSNKLGYYYYMVIKTLLGKTTIFTWGPIVPDIKEIPNGFGFSLERLDYKEKKIVAKINGFINNPRLKIDSVKQIGIEEASDQCKDLQSYVRYEV